MDHQAHGLDLKHPIFNTPRKASFTFTEAAAGEQYQQKTSALYPDGVSGSVRLTSFESEKDASNPIVVNHAGFFTDVPGLENLAEGNSAKVLGSLSLFRQGRFFYWGFSIDPERMTEPARDTFVNVLHYMHNKRHSLTVRFVCKPRMILATYLDLARRKPDYKRGIQEHFPGSLTPQWRETYDGSSTSSCAAWLDKHLPYVFSGKTDDHRGRRYKTVFEVDADALALQTPNAKRASLERWIALATGADPVARDRATRCLNRYVHPAIAPADGDWATWYAQSKPRIVFIESTGFWWQEDPRILEREHAAVRR